MSIVLRRVMARTRVPAIECKTIENKFLFSLLPIVKNRVNAISKRCGL